MMIGDQFVSYVFAGRYEQKQQPINKCRHTQKCRQLTHLKIKKIITQPSLNTANRKQKQKQKKIHFAVLLLAVTKKQNIDVNSVFCCRKVSTYFAGLSYREGDDLKMQMTKFAVSHLGAIPENQLQTQPDSYSKSRIMLAAELHGGSVSVCGWVRASVHMCACSCLISCR